MTEHYSDFYMNNAGGKEKSSASDLNTQFAEELDSLRELAKKQRFVLLACKQFLDQLQEKGLTLSFTERTAAGLLLEQIKKTV